MDICLQRSLDVYLNEIDSDYAIMIDGTWGSGKTYYVKNYMIPYMIEKYGKVIIYVSLFGVGRCDDIVDDIVVQIANQYSTEYLDKRGYLSGIKQVVPKCINVTNVASSLKKAITLIPKGEFIKSFVTDVNRNLIDFKKYIFVFDDLERCSISFNELLGLFNEVIKNDKEDKYTTFREKVFGINIKFNQDLGVVFDSLVTRYCKDFYCRVILTNLKIKILDMYRITKSNNIRTMIFSIKRFMELYDVILKVCNSCLKEKKFFEELIEEIIVNVFSFSLHWKETGKKRDFCDGNNEEYWVLTNTCFDNNELGYSYSNSIKVRKVINDYICQFIINEKQIDEMISDYIHIKENNINEIASGIDNIFYSNEDDVREKIKEILDNVGNDNYKLLVYPKILDKVFTLFSILNLREEDVECFKCNVRYNVEKRADEYNYSSWNTYPYSNENARIFRDELYVIVQKRIKELKLKKWFDVIETDIMFIENFTDWITSGKDLFLNDESLYENIIPKIVDRIFVLSNYEVVQFRSILNSAYSIRVVNLKDLYHEHADFFAMFGRMLEERIEKNKSIDRMLKFHLFLLRKDLQNIYEHLI